jgi:4-hydroxybenzoate polyprenyltransferase
LLLYEHSLVKVDDFSRLDAAFFKMNGVISIVFLGFVFTERLFATVAFMGFMTIRWLR